VPAEKAFCTGIDRMEQMGDQGDGSTDPDVVGSGSTPFMFNDPGDNIGPKSSDLWKPVIAAVNGIACGGAFYMLGEVEFIIAAEHATFFDPHVTYGMTAAFEPIHMSGIMPFGEIMRLSLLGNYERLSARRAYEIGLVSEITPKEQLHERTEWAAHAIASQPPLAIEGTVRAIWGARELGQRQALRLGYAYVVSGRTRTPSPRARSCSSRARASTGARDSERDGSPASRSSGPRCRIAAASTTSHPSSSITRPRAARWPTPVSTRATSTGLPPAAPGCSHRRGRRVPGSPPDVGRRHRRRRRHLGVHGRARHRRHRGRPRRGRRARVRLDGARPI